jgi:hypothetical protein
MLDELGCDRYPFVLHLQNLHCTVCVPEASLGWRLIVSRIVLAS